jgi:uncharacterized SAM-binding protein YcdF (DUF218 family)
MRLRRRLTILLVALLAYLGWNVRRFVLEWDTYSQAGLEARTPTWAPGSPEAIVVLTGARGRIPRAVQLLRQRDDGLLLISGAGKGISKKELLNQQGDSAAGVTQYWERIEVEDLATSTIENAKETAKFLRERKIEKVILVTSDYHMPRALEIFRRVYPAVEYFPYPVSSVAEGTGSGGTSRVIEGYGKPTMEFFKWFLFRHSMRLFL